MKLSSVLVGTLLAFSIAISLFGCSSDSADDVNSTNSTVQNEMPAVGTSYGGIEYVAAEEEYQEIGEGEFYLWDSEGTTQGNKVMRLSLEEGVKGMTFQYRASDLYGAYVYIDGELLGRTLPEDITTTQDYDPSVYNVGGSSEGTLAIDGKNFEPGLHSIEVIQYEGGVEGAEITFYRKAQYELEFFTLPGM
ncbi:MAG: hypothetical protein LBR39_07015 [Coriobacteriales bacterium]|jgi:hypothetical protein|nr:hypothetical protein [Coriobacteriales bacterium]